jgi:hypothetical protein
MKQGERRIRDILCGGRAGKAELLTDISSRPVCKIEGTLCGSAS